MENAIDATRQLDPNRIELLDARVIEVLRSKTPAERLEMAFACNRTMRQLLEGHLRSRHPDWNRQAIDAEIARRMIGGSS